MNVRCLALLIALFVPLGPSHAQHPTVLAKLNEWNDAAPVPVNEVLKTAIRKKAGEIYDRKGACSNLDIAINAIEPATSDQYVVNAIVHRTLRNAWFVTARLPGCDPAPVRFMVMQGIDNNLQTIRVNRGASYAWDSLIGDTLPSAQVAAIIALERANIPCKTNNTTLGVIQITEQEPNLGNSVFGIRYSGSWAEVWPIEACKRTVEILIKFTADGDGGAFTHIPGDTVRVLP